jgi:hypothetical protein
MSLVGPRTQREGPERGGYQIRFRPLIWCQTNHNIRLRNGWPGEHHSSRAPVAGTRAIWHIFRLLQAAQEIGKGHEKLVIAASYAN